jgi:ABC-type Mn2+/Zn2+ transport system permease subunit
MLALLHSALEPWQLGFMQRALAEIVLVGIAGGGLGCWIVLYELSYGAESLAHALFPGLVAAALLGIPLLAGGAAGLAVATVGIALAGRVPGIERDTAIGVAVTGLFGLGVLLALSPASPPGIANLLFGDLLGVSRSDLALAAVLAALVVVGLTGLHRQLLVVGFDRASARSVGGRPLLADVALLVLLALAILVAVQGLGNLLVVAVLVGPAATARLLVHRVVPMMALATGLTAVAGVAGLAISYYADAAAGAAVAACTVALYLVARAGVAVASATR